MIYIVSKTDGNSDLSSGNDLVIFCNLVLLGSIRYGMFIRKWAIPKCTTALICISLILSAPLSLFILGASACHQIIVFSSHESAMVALRVMTSPLIYLIHLFKFILFVPHYIFRSLEAAKDITLNIYLVDFWDLLTHSQCKNS